mmetsp:Transcript_99621/g.286163  ORF Transcript_99621/g.286163 Transcript_99621/m.286163 type:complete len:273 (-) Transcript_99621:294-1112(-)
MSHDDWPHYIFGYGSLICPLSRAVTAPTLAQRSVIPVRVQGLERIWSLPFRGLTFMGIRQRPQAECVGVLIPVNEDELAQFDSRELGYDRQPIPFEAVQELQEPSVLNRSSSFQQQQHHNDNDDDSAEKNKIQIWVYVQQMPQPVSKDSPIAQSYVDIILRGCISISEDFAKDFLKTTRGWHLYDHDLHPDHHDIDDACDNNSKANDGMIDSNHASPTTTRRQGDEHSVHWVDDRDNPLYVRADKEYSQANAHYLDQILREHRPEWVHRKRI